jgi:hypothetical protein
MTEAPPPRLHLLVARASPRILIIRRGPSRVFHLVMWDTETDEFEHGSWFRGRLYPMRCDLSYDGQWLVYFAFGPTRDLYSWVALSRPPWLKAKVLWPKEDCWNGGGVFLSRRRLWLNIAPDAQPRSGERVPSELGCRIEKGRSGGEDEGPFFRRLERDGWERAGDWSQVKDVTTREGWLYRDDPGWFLRPAPAHPALRMFYRGYYFNRGRVFEYTLDGHPGLLDSSVDWAGWDHAAQLVVAREGIVERYTLEDVERGEPSFRYDLRELTAPPRPQPRPHPARPEEPPAPARPGPDPLGRYHYLGDRERLRWAEGRRGHTIRSQADLNALAPVLRSESSPPCGRPQVFVVDTDGAFLLGGELTDDVEVAGGQAVLAAGEVLLEETVPGQWRVIGLNNRSYGYMPDAQSWEAVDKSLAGTGIDYPRSGFTEQYPLDGTWDEILDVLRE